MVRMPSKSGCRSGEASRKVISRPGPEGMAPCWRWRASATATRVTALSMGDFSRVSDLLTLMKIELKGS